MEFDRRARAVFILDEMEEMMRKESLCNFTIKVGSEEIKTHRVVLAASSKYFRSILRSDTQQSQSGFIDMFNIDLESAKICIDFIYNRKVMIPEEKYENLMYVANMMQLNELCDYIYAQLGENLDFKSFFTTRKLADEYGSKKLGNDCMEYAVGNLVPLSKEEGFGELDMEYICKVINSEKLTITEDEKLDVVLRFVRVEKKQKDLAEMIEWVDIGKVSLERKQEILKNEPLVSDNFKVYKIFTASAMDTLKQISESEIKAPLVQKKVTNEVELWENAPLHPGSTVQQDAGSRKPQTSGLQVAQNDGSTRRQNVSSSGSRTVSSPASARQLGPARRESAIVLFDEISKHLLHLTPRDNTVTQMKEMFNEMKGRYVSFSAITDDDYVCVLKKQKFHRFKYSDATSPWEQMPDMICDHGLRPPVTATMGCMYVCGSSGHTSRAPFEKFDPRERKWEILKDKPRASSASAVLASNGNVYSIGGLEHWYSATDRVERFNIASSTWAEVAPMKYARYDAAAVEANRSVFVLGGWVGDEFGNALDKVERYCVSSNQWTEIKSMKIARNWFKAFAIDGTIYAVGGRNSDAAWGSIEKYQVERDEWEVVALSSAGRKLIICDSVEIKT